MLQYFIALRLYTFQYRHEVITEANIMNWMLCTKLHGVTPQRIISFTLYVVTVNLETSI
jgi:hypothetical protein